MFPIAINPQDERKGKSDLERKIVSLPTFKEFMRHLLTIVWLFQRMDLMGNNMEETVSSEPFK